MFNEKSYLGFDRVIIINALKDSAKFAFGTITYKLDDESGIIWANGQITRCKDGQSYTIDSETIDTDTLQNILYGIC